MTIEELMEEYNSYKETKEKEIEDLKNQLEQTKLNLAKIMITGGNGQKQEKEQEEQVVFDFTI